MSSVTTPTLQSEILHETKPHLSYNHASSFRRNESSGDWADLDPVSDDLSYEADAVTDMNNEIAPQVAVSQAIKKPHYDRYAHRTIILSNLAEGVTHAEITAIVRGGMLLDIYLRTHDRSCAVSFLNAAEAKTFYDHIRRHNLYLRNKRVSVPRGIYLGRIRFPLIYVHRSKYAGLTVTSFFRAMLPIKSELVQHATLLCDAAIPISQQMPSEKT